VFPNRALLAQLQIGDENWTLIPPRPRIRLTFGRENIDPAATFVSSIKVVVMFEPDYVMGSHLRIRKKILGTPELPGYDIIDIPRTIW
jgi:hypothetical protein